MNTVIYARYSAGPRQTDQSIDGQLRVCTEFCKQRGLTVVDTYCDRHISGRTDAVSYTHLTLPTICSV